jgi:hypothetical protein
MQLQPSRLISRPRLTWKVGLAIYFAGFLICELLLLWSSYEGGSFDRPHTLADLAVTATIHLVGGLLWPVILAVFIWTMAGALLHWILS